MFKTIAAVAVVANVQATINGDFFQGAQTGAFITNAANFEDYSCPEPEMSAKVEQMMNMYNMAKAFAPKPPKQSKTVTIEVETSKPLDIAGLIEKFDKYADSMGIVLSVMEPTYEGGDFCQGLTVGYEARHMGQDFAMNLVKSMFNKQ